MNRWIAMNKLSELMLSPPPKLNYFTAAFCSECKVSFCLSCFLVISGRNKPGNSFTYIEQNVVTVSLHLHRIHWGENCLGSIFCFLFFLFASFALFLVIAASTRSWRKGKRTSSNSTFNSRVSKTTAKICGAIIVAPDSDSFTSTILKS